jgi:hypothetical protein
VNVWNVTVHRLINHLQAEQQQLNNKEGLRKRSPFINCKRLLGYCAIRHDL